jgi:hypothetical protein
VPRLHPYLQDSVLGSAPRVVSGTNSGSATPPAVPPSAFQAEGLRSLAGIRRSWFATRHSSRYGWSFGTPQPELACKGLLAC